MICLPREAGAHAPYMTVTAARDLTRTALFAALTAVGAVVAIPIPVSIVPVTLQLMFTLMSGMLLGARRGAASQLVYVTMGALGLPVFSRGGAGAGFLLGPTGGYIGGFVLGAWFCGILSQFTRRRVSIGHPLRLVGYILAGLLGLGVIHILGVWRLSQVLQVGLRRAAAVGSLPFLLPDMLKMVLAAVLVVGLEKRGLGES